MIYTDIDLHQIIIDEQEKDPQLRYTHRAKRARSIILARSRRYTDRKCVITMLARCIVAWGRFTHNKQHYIRRYLELLDIYKRLQ
jgi:uncharacterized tellurite resistance protein B-like protein